MHELILGGGKSGQSRRAESVPRDEKMRARISRHRARHLPALQTAELPHDLVAALREWCSPQRWVIVDGLTLCLNQQLMPPDSPPPGELKVK